MGRCQESRNKKEPGGGTNARYIGTPEGKLKTAAQFKRAGRWNQAQSVGETRDLKQNKQKPEIITRRHTHLEGKEMPMPESVGME